MANFNFLSGAAIDNVAPFLYDALTSGQAYLGFGRGTPELQWGVSALIYFSGPESASGANWSDTFVAKSKTSQGLPTGDTSSSTKFFDVNSLTYVPGSTIENRKVYIWRVENQYTNFENYTEYTVEELGDLHLTFVGENWAIVRGLNRYYYDLLSYSSSASYYILPASRDTSKALKIMNKTYRDIPAYAQSCDLYMFETSGASGTKVKSGLQRTINILGEVLVTGMRAPEIINPGDEDEIFIQTYTNKQTLIGDGTYPKFALKDQSGYVLVDDMTFVDPGGDVNETFTEISLIGNSQKYLTLRYPFAGSNQYIKLLVGTNIQDELAIWNEILPYDAVNPVSDVNPPALEVSYLKNPILAKSLFDIKGLTKIALSEVEFIKEILTVDEQLYYINEGFTIENIDLTSPNTHHLGILREAAEHGTYTIQLNDNHTFIVGDEFSLPQDLSIPNGPIRTYSITGVSYVAGSAYISFDQSLFVYNNGVSSSLPINYILQSDLTDIVARITVAKTTDKNKALRYGFSSAMITKEVPLIGLESPTEDIYRQLFISYKPLNSDGNLCSFNIEQSLFNVNTFEYDLGLILYMSNKKPIYRKWANTNEQFKIIL